MDCTQIAYMSSNFTILHAISSISVNEHILQHDSQIKGSHHDTSAMTTSTKYYYTLKKVSGSILQAGASKPLVVIPDATIALETYRIR